MSQMPSKERRLKKPIPQSFRPHVNIGQGDRQSRVLFWTLEASAFVRSFEFVTRIDVIGVVYLRLL